MNYFSCGSVIHLTFKKKNQTFSFEDKSICTVRATWSFQNKTPKRQILFHINLFIVDLKKKQSSRSLTTHKWRRVFTVWNDFMCFNFSLQTGICSWAGMQPDTRWGSEVWKRNIKFKFWPEAGNMTRWQTLELNFFCVRLICSFSH